MIAYPTVEAVEDATPRQLIVWLRFLPSPTDEQRPAMDLIVNRWQALDQTTRTTASKSVG